METIFALASAPGLAGVSVIRVSGPHVPDVFSALDCEVPTDGRGLRILRDEDGSVIDQALVLHFSEGRSFTGEEVCELQVHGSSAVISCLIRRLDILPNLRLAEAGEFTRRAFENGRLDLSQVEGLSDLLAAETDLQRKKALQIFSGQLAEFALDLKNRLLRISGLFAASIDFSDEDIPESVLVDAKNEIEVVRSLIQDQLAGYRNTERLREGFVVAIIGPPNVGKSTLLNRIAGRDAAIVSDIPGTTRDAISVFCDLEGLPVTFVDTAGLRETSDPVELLGIDRSKKVSSESDLTIYIDFERSSDIEIGVDDIFLSAKADISGEETGVSGLTGFGVDRLLSLVRQKLGKSLSLSSLIARERHRSAFEGASLQLEQALLLLDEQADVTLVSESVLHSVRELEHVYGLVGVEDILGSVFSSFCVGK